MNYKKILKVVGVAAVAAVFCIGCSEKQDDGNDEIDISKYRTMTLGTQRWMAEDLIYRDESEIDWKTALTVCPKGWHLPNFSEWMTAMKYVIDADSMILLQRFRNGRSYPGPFWSSTEISDSNTLYCYFSYPLGIPSMGVAEKTGSMAVRCVQDGGEYDTYYALNIKGCVETTSLSVTNVCDGYVSPNVGLHIYKPGTSVTVTATANADYSYAFSHWTGASSSTDSTITITMNGNKTLTPNFRDTDWKPMGFEIYMRGYNVESGLYILEENLGWCPVYSRTGYWGPYATELRIMRPDSTWMTYSAAGYMCEGRFLPTEYRDNYNFWYTADENLGCRETSDYNTRNYPDTIPVNPDAYADWKPMGVDVYVHKIELNEKDNSQTIIEDVGWCPLYSKTGEWVPVIDGWNVAPSYILLPDGEKIFVLLNRNNCTTRNGASYENILLYYNTSECREAQATAEN